MIRKELLLALALTFGFCATSHAGESIAITSCGQGVTARRAHLEADLDCSNHSISRAITFLKSVRFELNGFTLTGYPTGPEAISCLGNCRVLGGGGQVVGGNFGIAGNKRTRVYDTTITGQQLEGARGNRGLILENVTITSTGRGGATSQRGLKMTDTMIVQTGGVPDPETGEIRRTSAVVNASKTIRLKNSQVIDNFVGGIESVFGRVKLEDSTATGNGTDAECGVSWICYDVGGAKPPKIKNSTCNTSFNLTSCTCDGGSGFVTPDTDPAFHNWGVCLLDP